MSENKEIPHFDKTPPADGDFKKVLDGHWSNPAPLQNTPSLPKQEGEKFMPMHPADVGKRGCPRVVPFSLLNEGQAQKNHSQSLERLARRGGLDAKEMVAVIQGKPFRDVKMSTEEAIEWLNKKLSAKQEPDGPVEERDPKSIIAIANEHRVKVGNPDNALCIIRAMEAYKNQELSTANARIQSLEKEKDVIVTEFETIIRKLSKKRWLAGADFEAAEDFIFKYKDQSTKY